MRTISRNVWVGLAIIAACEALLYVDVQARGGAVVPDTLARDLAAPEGTLGYLARWVAINMTGLCWIAYLLLADGLLTTLAWVRGDRTISSLRSRPNRFVVAWLTSIPVWCLFDAINFYHMDAWRYHGLPPVFMQRLVGYFVAFAAISPGMFLAAQGYQFLGLRRLTITSEKAAGWVAWGAVMGIPMIIAAITIALVFAAEGEIGSGKMLIGTALLLVGPAIGAARANGTRLATAFAIGVSFTTWALLAQDPLSNMTLWVGLIYMFDPVNAKMGRPSLVRDWEAGRWGRTLALFAGGATCGLLWEFWNYWAVAKWSYHLPFLGSLEDIRYFEMPLLGFLGFLPFAAECWVLLETVIGVLDRLKLRVAERLPDSAHIF